MLNTQTYRHTRTDTHTTTSMLFQFVQQRRMPSTSAAVVQWFSAVVHAETKKTYSRGEICFARNF